jgi:uncharacterized protein (DUF1800 family)
VSNDLGPWAAYEPTPAEPWDLRKVSHLHRRAGFGATWAQMQRDLAAGPAASVGRLLKPPAPADDEAQVIASLRQGVLDSADPDRLKAWWLYRVLYDADPLGEKLTLFWHGHFATSNRKVQGVTAMLRQNDLLRRRARGPFGQLAGEIVGDAAMLAWLDGSGSKKERPNENFGREFLELFTLGVGHYTEKDVREAARAFTGYSVENGRGLFTESDHDAEAKTFLGRTGAWGPADVVRITLEQPACAEFLCRKLYRFFVSDTSEPGPELLRPLADEMRRTGYDVGHVVGVILRSRHFYSRVAYRQRVKCPVEFSAGLVRALDVPRPDVRLLALTLACDRQGQELFYPPTVKGWDGGRAWLSSTTVLERGNWCNDVVWGNPDYGLPAYDPLDWARRNHVGATEAAGALADLLLDGDLGPRAREAVTRAAGAATPDGLRKALRLLLQCPEFHLA